MKGGLKTKIHKVLILYGRTLALQATAGFSLSQTPQELSDLASICSTVLTKGKRGWRGGGNKRPGKPSRHKTDLFGFTLSEKSEKKTSGYIQCCYLQTAQRSSKQIRHFQSPFSVALIHHWRDFHFCHSAIILKAPLISILVSKFENRRKSQRIYTD